MLEKSVWWRRAAQLPRAGAHGSRRAGECVGACLFGVQGAWRDRPGGLPVWRGRPLPFQPLTDLLTGAQRGIVMKLVARGFCVALVGCLLACAGPVAAPGTGVDAKYNFAYEIAGRDKVLLSQVFDDGNQTYLQFRPDLEGDPRLTDPASGRRLPLARSGNYRVVTGTYSSLRLGLAGQNVLITNRAVLAPDRAQQTARPGDALALRAARPAAIADGGREVPAPPHNAPAAPDRLTVHFQHLNTTLSQAGAAAISAYAASFKDAPQVVVMGFTGSLQPTPQSKTIAIARAQVVRDALVVAGINATHIRVMYQSFCCGAAGPALTAQRVEFQRAEIWRVASGNTAAPPIAGADLP